MPNIKNQTIVDELTEKFGKAEAIYFTDYLGLDVASITNLRSQFFKSAVEYRVAKNTLISLAAKNNDIEDLTEYLSGSTALAISYEEPTAPAKILKDFAKKHELPTVKAVLLDGEILEGSALDRLADLPTKDVSLSMLIGGIQQPLTKLVGTLNAQLTNLVGALTSLKEQKS